MIKVYPQDNLNDLMRSISLASYEQLAYFFRDVLGDKAYTMLDNQLRHHILIESADGMYVQRHLAPLYKDSEAEKFIKAFWVIADFGSKNIKYITQAEYPVQYLFVDEKERNYDITVIPNMPTAELAATKRLNCRIIGVEDNTYHCAVINDPAMIPQLKKLGFDFFYKVDMEFGDVVSLNE